MCCTFSVFLSVHMNVCTCLRCVCEDHSCPDPAGRVWSPKRRTEADILCQSWFPWSHEHRAGQGSSARHHRYNTVCCGLQFKSRFGEWIILTFRPNIPHLKNKYNCSTRQTKTETTTKVITLKVLRSIGENRPTSVLNTKHAAACFCSAWHLEGTLTFHRRTPALSKDNSRCNSHSEVMWISDKLQRKLCTVALRGVSLPSSLSPLHCTGI